MAAADKWKRWRDCIAGCWKKCLDLALVLWIVRVPLCAVAIGWLILDYTPQAQDVLTEFSDHWGSMVLFLVLLTVVWALSRLRRGAEVRSSHMRRNVGASLARPHSLRDCVYRVSAIDLESARDR
jgi:hypothetical protein